jgi:hypothetical protein
MGCGLPASVPDQGDTSPARPSPQFRMYNLSMPELDCAEALKSNTRMADTAIANFFMASLTDVAPFGPANVDPHPCRIDACRGAPGTC